jgi:hypothetical protein
MIYLFLFLGLLFTWTVIEIISAPFGYENKSGFHLGKPDSLNTNHKGYGERL